MLTDLKNCIQECILLGFRPLKKRKSASKCEKFTMNIYFPFLFEFCIGIPHSLSATIVLSSYFYSVNKVLGPISLADGGRPRSVPRYDPNCSQFHAFIFWKIWQNHMLALPRGLAPPPTRNPGSASAFIPNEK